MTPNQKTPADFSKVLRRVKPLPTTWKHRPTAEARRDSGRTETFNVDLYARVLEAKARLRNHEDGEAHCGPLRLSTPRFSITRNRERSVSRLTNEDAA